MSAETAHRIAGKWRELIREEWAHRRPEDVPKLDDNSVIGILINTLAAVVADELDKVSS